MKLYQMFILILVVVVAMAAEARVMMKHLGKGGTMMSSSSMMSSKGSSSSSMSSRSKGVTMSSSRGKGGMMMMMMRRMKMMSSSSKGKIKGHSLVSQVDLGSIRPEGITAGPGSIMFASEFFFGGIKAVDVVTGKVTQVVPSFGYNVRSSVGLWYAKGAIFVAGGGFPTGVVPAVHVYSAKDGSEIVTCNPPDAAFFNDLIIYKGYLYVTDSLVPNVFVFDVHALLAGKCDYSTIALPASFSGEGFPFANGIEVYKNGLIVSNIRGQGAGQNPDLFELWYVDLKTGDATLLLPSTLGDGLLVDGDILYAAQPGTGVAVFELDYSRTTGVTIEQISLITSDLFRTATTVAKYKDMLYLVNSRFFEETAEGEADPATWAEDFDLVGVSAYDH